MKTWQFVRNRETNRITGYNVRLGTEMPVGYYSYLDAVMPEDGNQIDADRALELAVVRFGLEQQGHMGVIADMLKNGQSWDKIASKIGWERCSARTHYEARIGCESTRKIRSTLAEAIEVLRMVHARHKYDMTAEESNRMASVFLHGNNLLETKTFYDFDCVPTRQQ